MQSALEFLVAGSGRRTVYAFAYLGRVRWADAGSGVVAVRDRDCARWVGRPFRSAGVDSGVNISAWPGRDAVMHVEDFLGGCGVGMMLVYPRGHDGRSVGWCIDVWELDALVLLFPFLTR